MRSQTGWYWLAAGVLALGLNGAYQDGQLGWVHCLADRAAAVFEQASDRGLRAVTMAELMLGRSPEALGRTEAAFQKLQSKMVAQRVAQAQRQIAMAQARQQIAQARLQRKMDLVHMKMDKVRMLGIDRAHESIATDLHHDGRLEQRSRLRLAPVPRYRPRPLRGCPRRRAL